MPSTQPSRLIAMDTETDRGIAVLITRPDSFCEPKTWEDACEFLSHTKEMMCWHANYDVQAILKLLPAKVRNRIALLKGGIYREYKIKYIPNKFLRVWFGSRVLFTIYDLKQFYNCSLAKAAKTLGIQQKKDIPKSWYTQMKARLADPKTRGRVLSYGLGDAQTLQQIIDITVAKFAAAGIEFERPFSNASFAERFFRNKFGYARNAKVEAMAAKAYHGGRIECLRTGYFPTAYYYDIHSAYPSSIAELVRPDGTWFRSKEIRMDAVYAFIDCRINIPKSEHVGPIPFRRRSGVIVYPVGTFRKTITLTEYKYLDKRGWVEKIYDAWQHIWCKTNTKPFAQIYELYQRRKEDKNVDYALKILMNSVYGKLAQVNEERVRTKIVDSRAEIFDGRSWRKVVSWKKYTSFVYAAEVTARTRIKVLEEIPADCVVMYATDGVITTLPVPISLGPAIGQWDFQEVQDLIVVGSGVYSYKTPGKKVNKFRGFAVNIDLPKMLEKAGRLHRVSMQVLRNTSLVQAVDRPKDLNVLRPVTRVLNVNFDRKRYWSERWNCRNLLTRQFYSQALIMAKIIRVRMALSLDEIDRMVEEDRQLELFP